MGKVILKNVRLSGNPDTAVVDDKNGLNGKLNKTEDGRLFFIAELEDDDLFKTTKRNVMYSTNDKGAWAGKLPKDFAKAIGSVIPDARVVTEGVMPYQIGDRTVHSYSTIVLAKENPSTVFKQAGHTIINEDMYLDESTAEVVQKQPKMVGG